MGYDLFREKRPYAIFSQDYRMCVLDNEYLYVARKSGQESLYQYRSGNLTDFWDRQSGLADSMKMFACSHLKTAQWMIEKGLTGK